MFIKRKYRNALMKELVKLNNEKIANNDKNEKINLAIVARNIHMDYKKVVKTALYFHNKEYLEYIPLENCDSQSHVILLSPAKTYFEDMDDKRRETNKILYIAPILGGLLLLLIEFLLKNN